MIPSIARLLVPIFLLVAATVAHAAPKQIRVFVALCDNKTQGIMPVGEKIGNGDLPDANLYWGCSDGFGSYFRRSKQWKVTSSRNDVSPMILRRLSLRHVSSAIEIVADAYRGSQIQQCLRDFEQAAAEGRYDLVAFIGHNGLMDFELEPPARAPINNTQAIVLCCRSQEYFAPRLGAIGCKPILLTQQLMYPGAFLLHAAIEEWKLGGDAGAIRTAAARAYAQNQNISVRAASGVFTPPEKLTHPAQDE